MWLPIIYDSLEFLFCIPPSISAGVRYYYTRGVVVKYFGDYRAAAVFMHIQTLEDGNFFAPHLVRPFNFLPRFTGFPNRKRTLGRP